MATVKYPLETKTIYLNILLRPCPWAHQRFLHQILNQMPCRDPLPREQPHQGQLHQTGWPHLLASQTLASGCPAFWAQLPPEKYKTNGCANSKYFWFCVSGHLYWAATFFLVSHDQLLLTELNVYHKFNLYYILVWTSKIMRNLVKHPVHHFC